MQPIILSHKTRYSKLLLSLTTCLLVNVFSILPGETAERIDFKYGIGKISIEIEELETFAKTGKTEEELSIYLKFLSPQQQALLRNFLNTRYEMDATKINRIFVAKAGRSLFDNAGEIIQTEQGENGAEAMRLALATAAVHPDGLTPINILAQFPTDILINVNQIIEVRRQLFSLIQETKNSVNSLIEMTVKEAKIQPVQNFNELPDLRQKGSFQVTKQTLEFVDKSRNRQLFLDLYLPQQIQKNSVPLIIISNGIGATRNRFSDFAQNLASEGFAVAIADHPGSNQKWQQDFFAGIHQDNFEVQEFIDRPLDITFILDQLETLNSSQFNNQLNLQKVGLFGYSFGGATALALAGAEINFEQLEQDCTPDNKRFNISLLYQCRALELPRKTYSFKDDRIQALFLFVPFGKSIFGKVGMSNVQVPVFWHATNEDVLTPLVLEQVPGFKQLATPNKYFAVATGIPHTRVTFELFNRWMNQGITWDYLKQLSERYHNTLSTAFLKVYLSQDQQYSAYLTAAYIKQLSDKNYPLVFVRSLP